MERQRSGASGIRWGVRGQNSGVRVHVNVNVEVPGVKGDESLLYQMRAVKIIQRKDDRITSLLQNL